MRARSLKGMLIRMDQVQNSAEIIAQLREAGWTVKRIADALQVTERQVFRWQRGVHTPLPVFQRGLEKLVA